MNGTMIVYTHACLMAIDAGYPSNKDYWLSFYETPGFDAECERLWQEVKPLYEQLHAYVRKKLRTFYASRAGEFPAVGHIPAHILGESTLTLDKI
jgi:peptidyl-dipeptidase A